MSEHARARAAIREESLPTPEDVRRRLEGRAEVIEAALKDYRWLEHALKGRRWQRALRAEGSPLAELVEREAVLPDALERLKRRAKSEGWPEDTLLLQAMREVELLRARLEARVRERLESLAPVSGAPSLAEDLRQLAALVREPVSFRREPGETFSLHFQSNTDWPQHVGFPITFMVVVAGLMLMASESVPAMGLVCPAMGLLVVATVAATWRARAGDFWLTPRRLVWQPPGGEPVAVRLDSIADEGIRPDLARGGLRVEGDRRVHVPRVGRQQAERLRALLELYRHAELRARATLVERPVEAVLFPAFLRGAEGRWQEGECVLLRRMLFFFPGGEGGPALLRASTGRVPAGARLELAWVLEGLRWQPESDLDAYLLRAVKASRGAAWPAGFARNSKDVPLGLEAHFTYQGEVIAGKVERDDLPTAARLLESWS